MSNMCIPNVQLSSLQFWRKFVRRNLMSVIRSLYEAEHLESHKISTGPRFPIHRLEFELGISPRFSVRFPDSSRMEMEFIRIRMS
jgi:hypothetical protein